MIDVIFVYIVIILCTVFQQFFNLFCGMCMLGVIYVDFVVEDQQ